MLEDQLSRLDVATRSMDAVQRKADKLLRRHIDHAVEQLDESHARLGAVLREPLINGRSVPTEVGGFPVLRLTAIADGKLVLSERKGGRWSQEEASRYLVRRGDFLISRGNGSLNLVGRGALLEETPDEVAFPDTMIRVRVHKQLLRPEFLRIVWNARSVRRQIEGAARTTAGIYKVNQRILEAVSIPVPEIAIQDALIAEVERLSSVVTPSRAAVVTIVKRSHGLRRALLDAAFNGRLVPQDSDDEPASVLLGRIRAERAKQRKVPRGRRGATAQEEALL
jgi:type I restriction enzyme S subunit